MKKEDHLKNLDNKKSGCLLWIVVLFFIFVFLAFIGSGPKSDLTSNSDQQEQNLSSIVPYICQAYVKINLKAPATANFASILDSQIYKININKKQVYSMNSYVDSQNPFGADIRTYFYCKIEYLSGEETQPTSWILLDLKFRQ